MGSLTVELVEPMALLADGAGQPMHTTPISASACPQAEPPRSPFSCSVSINGVDLGAFAQGVAIKVSDGRGAPTASAWATVYSFVSADAVAAAVAKGGSAPLAGTAQMVTHTALNSLAGWVGLSAADLEARGAVLGQIVSPGTPPPALVGASIKPSQSGLTVGYGDADGKGVAGANNTRSQGLFVAVPAAPRTLMTATWRVVTSENGGTSKTPGPAFGSAAKVIAALAFTSP